MFKLVTKKETVIFTIDSVITIFKKNEIPLLHK